MIYYLQGVLIKKGVLPVTDVPQSSGDDYSNADAVDKYDIEEKLDKAPEMNAKHEWEASWRHDKPAGQKN